MKKNLIRLLFLGTALSFTFSYISAQTSVGTDLAGSSTPSTDKALESLQKFFSKAQNESSGKNTAQPPCLAVSLTKSLSKGQENSEVLILQQFLFASGYLTAKPNGFFGAGTVTAVKKFQVANGIPPVGSIGPVTRAAIKKRSCAADFTAQKISVGVQRMAKAVQDEKASGTKIVTEKNKQDIVSAVSLDAATIKNNFESKNLNINIRSLHRLINLGEKVAFSFIDDESSLGRIFYDGKEIGKEYSGVDDPVDINGEIAFTAITKNKKLIIVYRDKEYGEEYDTVGSAANISGKLTYLAAKNSTYFIISDGKKIVSDASYYGFAEVDGKLAYVSNTKGLVYDGKEYGKEYDGANRPVSLNKKLAYTAIELKDKKTFFVYDGKEYGKEYGFAINPFWLNGKLGFVAATQEKGYFIVYDGREITGDYSLTGERNIKIIKGKMAYLVNRKINGVVEPFYKSVIFYDGKYIGENYDEILDFIDVNGKLVYIAKKGKESFLVTEK